VAAQYGGPSLVRLSKRFVSYRPPSPGSTAYRIRAAMENEPSYWPAYSLIRIGGDVDSLIARLIALELRETSALKIVDKIAFIQLEPDLLT
jgi:hypothetical protein